MPKRLLKGFVHDTGSKRLTLTFSEKVSLSLVEEEGYDILRALKLGSRPFNGLRDLALENPNNEKVWIVFYTSIALKGRKVDDELVVVIETREGPEDPIPADKGAAKKTTKKKSVPSKIVKKKAAKPAASKKKASKKGVA